MTREQRRHKRYEVLDVRGSMAQNLEGELLNMSLTGLAVATRSLLKVGGKCRIRLAHRDLRLGLPAQIQWCRLVHTERTPTGELVPVYHSGLDFREALDGNTRELLTLIESCIVVEMERRLVGRFKVDLEEPVRLRTSYEFEVRRISLSGMKIETGFVPEVGAEHDLEIRSDGTLIEARGRIAHVQEIPGDEERSVVGVELMGLSAESRRALEALIEAQIE